MNAAVPGEAPRSVAVNTTIGAIAPLAISNTSAGRNADGASESKVGALLMLFLRLATGGVSSISVDLAMYLAIRKQ